jgi:hypothetical protein
MEVLVGDAVMILGFSSEGALGVCMNMSRYRRFCASIDGTCITRYIMSEGNEPW